MNYTPETRPWRTQINVVDIDGDNVWVIVMGRNCDERICIYNMPSDIRRKIKVGSILHAHVNVGARTPGDLCFDQWEIG